MIEVGEVSASQIRVVLEAAWPTHAICSGIAPAPGSLCSETTTLCVEGRVFERMVACVIYVFHLLPVTPCSDTQDASNDDIGA